LAAVLARNGKPSEAFKALENDLGRGLLDDINARSRPLTHEERLQEQDLSSQLATIDKQLDSLKKLDSKTREDLARRRDRLILQRLQFQAKMEEQYEVAAGKVFSLQRIQKILPADVALVGWLDYVGHVKADGEHWGVVVRNQGDPVWIKLKGTGPDGAWRKKDIDLPAQVRDNLHTPRDAVDWQALLTALARQRLTPLEKHLEGVTHVVVLPSDVMAGIPLEVLSSKYLVSYAPSATMFAWLQENRKKFPAGADRLLALGDPIFSVEQAKERKDKESLVSLVRGDREFGRLLGSRGEVEAIANLFRTKAAKALKLLGADAKGQMLDELAEKKELARFRYLHLATHAVPDERSGMNSFLPLTSEEPDTLAYSKLTAGHILSTWKLDADLVTLSACETALGEHRGGEGYVGFAQALFLAGAHSLVLSQWQAKDWTTTLLMERFYQNLLGARPGLKEAMAKGEALAEARNWLKSLGRQEALQRMKALGIPVEERKFPEGDRPFEHPHYWAPFILIGDAGPPSDRKPR
jgi:CHAT domain-containing protein